MQDVRDNGLQTLGLWWRKSTALTGQQQEILRPRLVAGVVFGKSRCLELLQGTVTEW